MVLNKRKYDGLSTLFYGFVSWIQQSCQEQDIEDIYFFTREGELFKKIYDEIVNNKLSGDAAPQAHILEVSRIATFAPSILSICVSEFQRMWSLYNRQSIKALILSLGMTIEEFVPFLQKYDLLLDEIIENPGEDFRIKRFLQDCQVKKILEKNITEKRENLILYFQEKGIEAGKTKRIAVVDIGWRGTIQDNLCRIFPEIQWVGYYLCLDTFLNEQPLNGRKLQYITREKGQLLLRYPSPIEMICNSSEGSVCEYIKVRQKVNAVRQIDEAENRVFMKFTKEFQRTILGNISKMSLDCCDKCKVETYGIQALNKFLLYPPKAVANAFFSLHHNEMFGMGKFIDKKCKIQYGKFIKACFNKSMREQLKVELYETTWPQGYFVNRHLTLLCILYNILLCKYM